MRLSPLQITRYVVTDIGCTANPKFNPEKEIQGALEQFSSNAKINPLEPEKDVPGHSWAVELVVKQQKREDQNFPYVFHISILGFFGYLDGVMDSEKETQFVQVNGSSMLYAIAREHIRSLTGAGPWGPIILPTISFYDNKEEPKKEALPPAPPESK